MAKSRRKTTNLADYDHPPVVEVVYGVKFTPLKGWMLPHIGAFWQRVKAEFPECEHAPPISDPNIADTVTGLPLPRVWLINDSSDRLVQLQPGRLLFNWRHRQGGEPYPRYRTLSKRFFDLFREFREFVAEYEVGDIELLECELTYINHVFEQEGWALPQLMGKVVNQIEWNDQRHQFLPRPSSMNWQAGFSFHEQPGELSIKLNPAKRAKDEKRLLILELSAQGLPAKTPIDHMEGWFSHAHEWIVRGFGDLTSDEAQNELWGKHE